MSAYFTFSEGQRGQAGSKLLTTAVAAHPDLGCGYLAVWTLTRTLKLDPLHPDQTSGNLSILFCFFFWIRRFGVGSGCLGLKWVHCLINKTLFSWINDLMSQRTEASNCSGCPLCQVKAAFCLLPPFVLEYKSVWKWNMGTLRTQSAGDWVALAIPSSTSLRCVLISAPLKLFS